MVDYAADEAEIKVRKKCICKDHPTLPFAFNKVILKDFMELFFRGTFFVKFMLYLIGSFSNDGGDGNKNVKKAIGLIIITTVLHVQHAFCKFLCPSLYGYDVKMPNFTFYGGRTQATTNFFLSF